MKLEEETKKLIQAAKAKEKAEEWADAKKLYLDAASFTLKIAKQNEDPKEKRSYEAFTKILIEMARDCKAMIFVKNLPSTSKRKLSKNKHDQLIIRKTPSVYALFVIKEGGTPVLTHYFAKLKDKIEREINEILFSGAITAISSLMKEAFERPIQMINFDDGVLLIQQYNTISYILYAGGSSPGLKKKLKRFADELDGLGHEISKPKFIMDLTNDKDILKLIDNIFK